MKILNSALFFSLLFSTMASFAQAATVPAFECAGRDESGNVVLADLLDGSDRNQYIKMTVGSVVRFFLVDDVVRGQGTYYSGQEFDARTGRAINGRARLMIPRILMNRGTLRLGDSEIDLRCESAGRDRGTRAL